MNSSAPGSSALESLAVPKRQVRVSLTSARERVEGFIFVAEFSERIRGAQRVGEILNDPMTFLPLRHAGTDRVYLYSKRAIRFLTVLDPEPTEVEELELSPRERIEITLTSGEVLDGFVHLDPRPEKGRVQDRVNRPEGFLLLLREDHATYVSKRHILRVGVS